MTWYAGIDLGTTNSAIATFDGVTLRLHKSPEQNDVTPSVIHFGPRGSRFVGQRAYNHAATSPQNIAMHFKRMMGSRTPIEVPGAGLTLTPEECSAEILRALVGYLPEEARGAALAGIVITVPAAFDQLQKEATMAAATQAGIGAVALMQEPVAAVMSVMRARQEDGRFLVFDFGGGTLDVAIAENIAGRVSLIANGGIAVCGGRDFDRAVLHGVVGPWLLSQFNLSESALSSGSRLDLMAAHAVERAKIDLSSRESTRIQLQEDEWRQKDSAGKDLYLDIPFDRSQLDEAIRTKLRAAVEAAKDTLRRAGLTAGDVERIVFVGGPTKYKPLRDLVSAELGIPGVTDVDPMTAVAEGAAIFAEALDWKASTHSRKASRGNLSVSPEGISVAFKFTARTPSLRGRIIAAATGPIPQGAEFQVDCLDTGWSSGRLALVENAALDLPLAVPGDNRFKIFMFSPSGVAVTLDQNQLVITRTAATVDAIPASHSIAVEVLEKLGGSSILDYLVKAGDPLPTKGRKRLKAAESLKAGSTNSINIKLWEGEIRHPVTDNRLIGTVRIAGGDLDDGVISAGADLECDFEILDSGTITVHVAVPSIGQTFHGGRNFYSTQEGQLDFAVEAERVSDRARVVLERIDKMAESVDSDRLAETRHAVEQATQVTSQATTPEACKEAHDALLSALRVLAETRSAHLPGLRGAEIAALEKTIEEMVKPYARESELTAIGNLLVSARRAISRDGGAFEDYLDEIRGLGFGVLWRQDWFVVDRFNTLAQKRHLFADVAEFAELVAKGREAVQAGDMDQLRSITGLLSQKRLDWGMTDEASLSANILRG